MQDTVEYLEVNSELCRGKKKEMRTKRARGDELNLVQTAHFKAGNNNIYSCPEPPSHAQRLLHRQQLPIKWRAGGETIVGILAPQDSQESPQRYVYLSTPRGSAANSANLANTTSTWSLPDAVCSCLQVTS